jgi:hypothetical protein
VAPSMASRMIWPVRSASAVDHGITGVLLNEDDAGAIAPGAHSGHALILFDVAAPVTGRTVD